MAGLAAVVLLAVGGLGSKLPCSIHVDPLGGHDAHQGSLTMPVQTLHGARDRLRQILKSNAGDGTDDIVVCLGPGVHSILGDQLDLGEADSPFGTQRVVWRGSGGSEPTVVSGGVALTQWRQCEQPGWEGVWMHARKDAPGLGQEVIRQIWVNGTRATRRTSSGNKFGLKATDVGYAANQEVAWSIDVELRWPEKIKNWIEPRCTVASVQGTNIVVEPSCWKHLKARVGGTPPAPTIVENIAGPPGPGEFYANSTTIFYRPQAWTRLAHAFNSKSGSTMVVGDYIVSPAGCAHARLEATGAICIHQGSSPQQQGAKIWCSGSAGDVSGEYRAFVQGDGNLCVYRGAPSSKTYVWCANTIAHQKQNYEATLQDDGNLCVRPPMDPHGPNVWCANSVGIPCYKPLPSREPSQQSTSQIHAWAPVKETLISAKGLHGHTWEDIDFRYSTWLGVNRPGGYVESQTGVHACDSGSCEPVGTVQVSSSTDIKFDKCRFANIGSLYALGIGGASQGVAVTHCAFHDLSGGALKLGNVLDGKRAVTNNTTDWDTNMTIQDNNMEGVASEYRGASALFVGYVAHTVIDHNSIYNTGYTGISLGWGWGSVVSYANDNHVTHNHLSFVMQALNDGGCVYTLGPQPGSTVSDNYCHSDKAPVVGLFYHDNGSRYFTTQRNVAESSPAPCVYLQGCCNKPALDIHVDHLWCKSTAPTRNGCAAERCVIDSSTVYTLKWSDSWSKYPDAQKVIQNAGARSARKSSETKVLV